MIDYLFHFPDEAAAHTALDPLGCVYDGQWQSSYVLPVKIGVGYETRGTDETSGEPMQWPVYASGYWLVISVAEVDEALWVIDACMREADRAKAELGQPYVLRERFTPEQLAAPWWVTPQWAGVVYENKGASA